MREVIPLLWVGAMALGNQLVKSHWKLVATKGNPILGINRGDSWHQVSRHWLCSKLSVSFMVLGAPPVLEEQPNQLICKQRQWPDTPDMRQQVTDCLAGPRRLNIITYPDRGLVTKLYNCNQRPWPNK